MGCTRSLAAVFVVSAVACSAQKVFTNPNTAMEPTILKGEKFSVEMKPFQPSRGDPVIFEHDRELILKRAIAVPGDKVQGRDNQIFVNGSALSEPYVQHVGPPHGPLATFGAVTIPEGKIFVAGDNRDYSFDSRTPTFGLVSIGDVKGRPIKILESSDPRRVGKTLH